MDKELLKLYSWVLAGSQRTKVIKNLEVPKTPMLIQKETKLNFGNVSNVLKSLREKNLVILLNPEDHLGKIYQLSELGEKVLNEVKKL